MENKTSFGKKRILSLGLLTLILSGCATSTSYVNYTTQRFAPKDQFYTVNIYPENQAPMIPSPYYVIGKVSIEGFASNGVNPEGLSVQARQVARKKGADAIINARTEVFRYYGDALLRFKGDLVVYAPGAK